MSKKAKDPEERSESHSESLSSEPLARKDQVSEEAIMEELASIVVESVKEGFQSEWEPFEIYAQKLRSHLHTNAPIFCRRFARGYESLLDVLEETHKKG